MAFLTNAMRNAYSFGIALESLPVVALVFFSFDERSRSAEGGTLTSSKIRRFFDKSPTQ